VAPAIAPDGTVYSVSRAHLRSRYSYLLAVNPDLTPKWQASLRGHLDDGCDALLPNDNGGPNGIGCRTGSPHGVDPATNESPAGRVIDQSSSSPTVAPDGSVLYGSYSRYNFARGHLWKFSPSGQFLGTFDFGWDTTPAIFQHGGTYSIVLKDNHYEANCCPTNGAPAPGPFFMTQLSSTLGVEWQFKSTTKVLPDNPNGFEWCINAPAIDTNGVVYANSEDGNVYAINQGGTLKQKIFLRSAIGAAYTPLAIGRTGLLYTENDGHLFVVGQ
jgi:outer membrane protein assembly factor BamB